MKILFTSLKKDFLRQSSVSIILDFKFLFARSFYLHDWVSFGRDTFCLHDLVSFGRDRYSRFLMVFSLTNLLWINLFNNLLYLSLVTASPIEYFINSKTSSSPHFLFFLFNVWIGAAISKKNIRRKENKIFSFNFFIEPCYRFPIWSFLCFLPKFIYYPNLAFLNIWYNFLSFSFLLVNFESWRNI